MNRQQEYESLRQELSAPVPAEEHTLTRALARNRRRKRIVRPAAGLASAFACFVLLVNFCTPVAYACAGIPFLRELAQAVTFSRSLEDAVRHEYAQPVNLVQTDGGVTAKVEYLIVDQKQVNIFFRLESEQYENLDITPTVRQADGSFAPACYGLNNYEVPNGTLQSMTVDFTEEDVPETLRLELEVRNRESWVATEEAPAGETTEDPLLSDVQEALPGAVAKFDFLLQFDPAFTAMGEKLAVGQTVTLDGQKITLTELEIYPTHLRINVEDDAGNTAWLKRLDFYIVADGKKFDKIANGITATGSTESPMMTSYRADSIYFYQADRLSIVITGAEWLAKDMETVRVDLSAGTADRMPEGAELWKVDKKGEGYMVTVRAAMRKQNAFHQVFGSSYYDASGKRYEFNRWSSGTSVEGGSEQEGYFYETFPLLRYPYSEVWLSPSYSSAWVAPQPITVVVK